MAEVIIIGCGVVGASIAYHLAKSGCGDVIVLEKDFIGSGSTGKCPGGIRQQFSSEVNIKLSMESIKVFSSFEEELGYPIDYHQYGYLLLATTPDELELFHQNIALQRSLGLEVHLLSPQEVKGIIPLLNVEEVLGATYCPSDGYADPNSVVTGFAHVARQLGVRIYEETKVTHIEVKQERIQGVITSKGDFIKAPVVVNAAGPYAAQVAEMAEVKVPVQPIRRHLFVTAPLNRIGENVPMVIDFHTGFWFRREGPGLIFGMRNPREPPGFDTSVDWSFLSTIGEVMLKRLPSGANLGIIRGQAGLHADTPDYHAILGEVQEVKGLFLACGFSGHGFMHSPAVGKLIAELILEGKTSTLDISPLGLERFKSAYLSEERSFI